MKEKFSLMIFAAILFFVSTVKAAPNLTQPEFVQITADSAILVEASTGRVLFEKNADVVRPPASLTKMMTCILGLEKMFSYSEVEVSQNAEYTDYSTLNLHQYDIVNSYELLTGMMLVSDNGAAVAIAENIAGTVPLFSVMMNEKAREIGCEHTNFANPNGLPNANHVSTARDMAKIAMYCMQNENFRQIVATQKMIMHWTRPAGRTILCENTNELLYKDEKSTIKTSYNPAEITGIKTGYTDAAGGCLAASAKRGDVELIAIILNASGMYTRFNDAAKLLNYGFDNVTMTRQILKGRIEKTAFVRGGTKATVRVGIEENIVFPLMSNEDPKNLSVTYDFPKFLDAGIERGQIVGKAILNYAGEPVATVPMVARENVEEGFSLTSRLVVWTESFFLFAQSFWNNA